MAKTLGELASEYAQKEFPVYPEKNDIRNIGKHDVAFHAFADGWNAAKRESPWISIEDDLPCLHKELMSADRDNTVPVFVAVKDQRNNRTIYMPSVMVKLNTSYDEWRWEWANDNNELKVTHWMPIPNLERE